MSSALFVRFKNARKFPFFIQEVALSIKDNCGVKDWQTATELQLKQRDSIHKSVKLLSRVLTDTNQILRIAFEEAKTII